MRQNKGLACGGGRPSKFNRNDVFQALRVAAHQISLLLQVLGVQSHQATSNIQRPGVQDLRDLF